MYVVNKKDNSIKYYPLEVREEGVMITYKERPTLISWNVLLRDFEWVDGSMCGYVERENMLNKL